MRESSSLAEWPFADPVLLPEEFVVGHLGRSVVTSPSLRRQSYPAGMLDSLLIQGGMKHTYPSGYPARQQCLSRTLTIKVTMHMDVLRCKTPAMARRKSGRIFWPTTSSARSWPRPRPGWTIPPRDLSFAEALQTSNAFCPLLQTATTEVYKTLWQRMLAAIGSHRVGQRPDRVEPRAVKRRPKPHRLLTIPRKEAQRQLLAGTYG